jgi:acylphosphatase
LFRRSANTSKVIGEAQGEEDDLRKLLKDISKGPRWAHVVKVEKSEIEVKEDESSFAVI